MERRSGRLGERADKQAEQAAVTRKKATDVFESIPFGQPILIGHHSEKADRNRRERAAKNMRKSLDQANHAADLARQSETAAQHMDYRAIPTTVDNRIDELEADRRRWQRELDGEPGLESYTDEHGRPRHRRITRYPSEERGEWLRREIAELDEQLEYWRGEYRRLQQEGKASALGPDDVAKGDWILRRGDWMRVRRVNRKSVSVPKPRIPRRWSG